jgi:hypothetical protein
LLNRTVPPRAAYDEPWHQVGLILIGLKARAARNRIVLTRRKNPVKTFFHFIVAMPVIAGLTALLAVGFSVALNGITDESIATTFLASIVALVLIGAFIGSSTTALQALYLADDIPFLLTLPVPLRALFGGKFVEAAVGALPPGILFTAATLGYASVRTEHPTFWVISPVVGVGIIANATAISVITVSLVTRYVPPRRARLFLFAISLLLVSCTAVAWRYLAPRPDALTNVVNREEYVPLWRALAWTPVGWGATAMTSAATGSPLRATVLAGLLILATCAIVAISYNVFRRTFIRGLAQTRAAQISQPNETVTRWMRYAATPLPQRLGAVALKEWFILTRDLRRMSGAIWPVGMVIIYAVVLGRGDGSAFGSQDLAFWSMNGSLALLPWGLSLGISVYSIGSEGRNVHLLRTLPLPASRIFLAKVLASLLPVGLLSLGASALALWIRSAPMLQAIELLSLIAWMIVGYVVIDTAAAAIAPNFESDQVQRTITLSGRLFSFAAGSVFGLTSIAAAARLILMSAEPPKSLVEILTISASGVDVFGWPLIIFAGCTAIGIVCFSSNLAIKQTERLLRYGV